MMKKIMILLAFFYGTCFANDNFSGINCKKEMTIKDVLDQTDLKNVVFIPGCFNCPSRIEIPDTLVVDRPQDDYTTTFTIDGYNTEYINFVTKATFPNFDADADDLYSYMDKMEEISKNTFNREEFKHQAIKTYKVDNPIWKYETNKK